MQLSRIFLGNWEAVLFSALVGWLTAGLLLLSRRSRKYLGFAAYFAIGQVSCMLMPVHGIHTGQHACSSV